MQYLIRFFPIHGFFVLGSMAKVLGWGGCACTFAIVPKAGAVAIEKGRGWDGLERLSAKEKARPMTGLGY